MRPDRLVPLQRRLLRRLLLGIVVPSVILAGLFTFVLAPATSHAAGAAFVRINQLGYATTATKRAYLMASASEAGATFSVKNSGGTTVASGNIGTRLGSWSSGYPDVYAVDFDSVTTLGTYTISVTGPIAATSPSFSVDTASNLYAVALANALSFYQNERDGANYIPQHCGPPRSPQQRQCHDLPDPQSEQERGIHW